MAGKKRKIGILGFAASTINEAPFQDQTWELWGLNELWRNIPNRSVDNSPAWDVWFEVHPWASLQNFPGQMAWLQNHPADGKPIYMQRHFDSIPASRPIPVDELINEFGAYFTCGPAYMLAMAILEPDVGQIGIWGIDMLHDTEYAYQRPCMDYFIGVARGRGISVYIPEGSSLAKADGLYGYDHLGPASLRYRSVRIKKRREMVMSRRDEALCQLYNCDGALSTISQFGKSDDITGFMSQTMVENNHPADEVQTEIMRAVLGDYCSKVGQQITAQRDEILKTVYTLDGELQSLNYLQDIDKHRKRFGV